MKEVKKIRNLVTTNNKLLMIILFSFAILISLSSASAADWYVNTTGNDTSGDGSAVNPYLTIGKGINSASDDDIVIISDGIYSGTGNTEIQIDKDIYITGQSQTGTIIDGNNTNWIFEIEDATVLIQKLTIQNAVPFYGNGAIYNDGDLTVIDCTFQNNNIDNGVIHNEDELTVINSTFTNNNADYEGGAICNCCGDSTIIGCTFENNSADYAGGALYSSGDSLTVANSIFTDNYAEEDGGAIFSESELTIIGCNFNNNTAEEDGGAIYSEDNLYVKYSRFVGNTADDEPQDIYMYDYESELEATLNWWGSNSGPADGRVVIMDTALENTRLTYTPWLVMNIKANPITVPQGQTSKITADVYTDSEGIDHSADADQFFSGPEVTFTTTLGNVGSKEITLPWTLGSAFATLRADEGTGTAAVTAADDETLLTTSVTILPATANAATVTTTNGRTIGLQETGLPISYLILAILALFGGLVTSKRK
jgi:predicted outer membrane repeat protein